MSFIRDVNTNELYYYSAINAVCPHCMNVEVYSRLYQSAYSEYVTYICYSCLKELTYDFKTYGKRFDFDKMDWSLLK